MGAQQPDENEHFFKLNFLIVKIAGMWHPDESVSKITKYLFWTYNIWSVVYIQALYTPLELAMAKETFMDLEDFIEYLGRLLTHFLTSVKVLLWHFKQKDIMYLINFINDERHKYESYEEYQPKEIFHLKQLSNKTLFTFFFGVASFVPASKLIASYNYILDDSEIFFNNTCKHYLPYYSKIPFPTSNRLVCGSAIIFQIIPMTFYAWQIAAHDTIYACILSGLVAHLVTLQGAFRTIRPRCLRRLGLDENYDILYDSQNPALEREMMIEMKKTTYRLQQLIGIRDQFESIFTYITLCQTLITLFVMATCLFMVTNVPLLTGKFAAEFEYFFGVMLQISMYSWFSNEIAIAFSGLKEAIFDGDWFSASESFKKCMLINMDRIKRPYFITIGKFGPLTLSTVVTLLRGAYSYYTVLSKADKN